MALFHMKTRICLAYLLNNCRLKLRPHAFQMKLTKSEQTYIIVNVSNDDTKIHKKQKIFAPVLTAINKSPQATCAIVEPESSLTILGDRDAVLTTESLSSFVLLLTVVVVVVKLF